MGPKSQDWVQDLQDTTDTLRRREAALCLKDKFRCEGYEPPKTWLFEPSPKEKLERSESNPPLLQPLASHSDSPTTKGNQTFADLSRFLLEPSSPWVTDVDRSYTQLFLLKTAPLISTTRKWRHFWQFIVPQAAWDNPSVHHGMVAVAATFDSYISGADHTTLILDRRAQAVRAFTNHPPSWDVALILCRLFSSMAQCNGDFTAAMAHMKSGEKILREATQNGQTRSDIVRLMAATFMGLSADANNDISVIRRFLPSKRRAFLELKVIGSDYGRLLRRIAPGHNREVDTPTMGFLSIAFTMMNQAISSAMYPDLLVFSGDDGVVPAAQIRTHLMREDSLLALDDLIIMYPCLCYELEQYFEARATTAARDASVVSTLDDLKKRLKLLVDNYVVQALEVEPRMTAGTFWLDDEGLSGCLMDKHLDRPQSGVSPDLGQQQVDAGHHEDPVLRERREYYHEYVCHYKSGFMC
ncbi:hypothetical protein AYL99_06211 [Fonsecaea erecta]|uniref:Uncharacterized protein n=1 Tax=Fonsecaea erecta TaxID=1367422 RepID=A0A178ZGI3_9EURO|nr:hypothetical protein AYL99_06211 [Fonsecaea erecta]OAP58914.1 hypothetical protein AYL99_06211 [Fonsecaea erecta]